MNLEKKPTIDELRALIGVCDDLAGHHVLWVAKNGDVHITRVPKNQTPPVQPDMQLRYETFEAGNEYVGPKAAADDDWINELFEALTREWPRAKSEPVFEPIDRF
jgi:hypothetical protein